MPAAAMRERSNWWTSSSGPRPQRARIAAGRRSSRVRHRRLARSAERSGRPGGRASGCSSMPRGRDAIAATRLNGRGRPGRAGSLDPGGRHRPPPPGRIDRRAEQGDRPSVRRVYRGPERWDRFHRHSARTVARGAADLCRFARAQRSRSRPATSPSASRRRSRSCRRICPHDDDAGIAGLAGLLGAQEITAGHAENP